MPAKSQNQQKFMGMVHAVQKGELSPNEVSPEVRKAAKTMKKKDAKDFASTKHRGLPVKKEDKIAGGKGDETKVKNVDSKELQVGIAVEKEHTSNTKTAEEIALDHLEENPKYYTDLIKSGIVDEKEALVLAKKFGMTTKVNEFGAMTSKAHGYTKDGIIQFMGSKQAAMKQKNIDKKKNPKSKFQLIFAPGKKEGQKFINELKKWDKGFHSDKDAQLLATNQKFKYVPFHALSSSDQSTARRMYPHKSVGGKYDFRDEHYYYPVKKDGSLASASRLLGIPLKMIQNDRYMSKLGYKINQGWNESVNEKKQYWLSPVGKTDDFGDKISDEIIDAATSQGPWALMTPSSFKKYGKGKLGYGHGQRYKKQNDGKWLKVENKHEKLKEIIREIIREENSLIKAKSHIKNIFKQNDYALAPKEYKNLFSKAGLKTHGTMAMKFAWNDLLKQNKIHKKGSDWVFAENINEYSGNAYYELEYYARVGEHGEAGGHPDFKTALKKGIAFAKRKDIAKEIKDNDLWYVGINPVGQFDNQNSQQFAIIYVNKEYINNMNSAAFSDSKDYKTWLKVANRVLKSGKPALGDFN